MLMYMFKKRKINNFILYIRKKRVSQKVFKMTLWRYLFCYSCITFNEICPLGRIGSVGAFLSLDNIFKNKGGEMSTKIYKLLHNKSHKSYECDLNVFIQPRSVK